MSKWGALFDFDGVIADTVKEHELCWKEVAKERNQPITHDQYLLGFGVKNHLFIRDILKWSSDPEEIEAIADRKEAIFQAYIQTHKIELVKGFDLFLKKLASKGIASVIASSSIYKNIELILAHYDTMSYVESVVSGENVSKGKPDPEVFLTAAKRIGIEPANCVVFEDALYGIEAAKRAGCKVVGLTTSFSKSRLEAYSFLADVIVNDFTELCFDEIDGWF